MEDFSSFRKGLANPWIRATCLSIWRKLILTKLHLYIFALKLILLVFRICISLATVKSEKKTILIPVTKKEKNSHR